MTKCKSGKLQKKEPRTLADAAVDLDLHIQKNQSLYDDWLSMARKEVIQDGGALTGNKMKRHLS